MRYIDAEKLKAEIERLLAKAENDEKTAFKKKDAAGHLAAVTKTAVCVKIKKLITSLQQEQTEFPKTDEEVEKFLATAPNVELPKKYENPDWLFKKQEQSEVDLEKLGGIARHLIAVKDHEEDMRLDEGEWLLLERIGYPERFNARKEE